MSSGFVSGGTTDNPIARDEEWLKAQREVEANRLRKEEEGRQEGGKSLYEVLQNNKGVPITDPCPTCLYFDKIADISGCL